MHGDSKLLSEEIIELDQFYDVYHFVSNAERSHNNVSLKMCSNHISGKSGMTLLHVVIIYSLLVASQTGTFDAARTDDFSPGNQPPTLKDYRFVMKM